MGCAQSKIENEETVTRCKERKRLMKEAVTARNAFAAAHSAYAMALKNTGAALSDYSHGEFLFSSSSSTTATAIASTSSLPTDISPPPPPSAAAVSNSVASSSSSSAIPQPIPDNLPPPPPPPLPPLQRAATMPEMNGRSVGGPSANGLNGIEEDGTLDDDDDDGELENRDRLIRKSRSRGGSNRGRTMIEDHHHQEEEPPSLPPANLRSIPPPRQPQPQPQPQHQHQQQQPFYDYFFPNVESMPGTTLEDTPPQLPQPHVTKPLPPQPRSPDTEEGEEEEEEEEEEDDDDDDDSDDDEEEEEEEEAETVVEQKAPVEEKSKMEEVSVELEKASNMRGMKKSKGLGMAGERRGVRMPVTTNLVNLFLELDDNFLKASESAHEVSKMLEATRLHYHSNFADNRGNDFNNFNKMIFF